MTDCREKQAETDIQYTYILSQTQTCRYVTHIDKRTQGKHADTHATQITATPTHERQNANKQTDTKADKQASRQGSRPVGRQANM